MKMNQKGAIPFAAIGVWLLAHWIITTIVATGVVGLSGLGISQTGIWETQVGGEVEVNKFFEAGNVKTVAEIERALKISIPATAFPAGSTGADYYAIIINQGVEFDADEYGKGHPNTRADPDSHLVVNLGGQELFTLYLVDYDLPVVLGKSSLTWQVDARKRYNIAPITQPSKLGGLSEKKIFPINDNLAIALGATHVERWYQGDEDAQLNELLLIIHKKDYELMNAKYIKGEQTSAEDLAASAKTKERTDNPELAFAGKVTLKLYPFNENFSKVNIEVADNKQGIGKTTATADVLTKCDRVQLVEEPLPHGECEVALASRKYYFLTYAPGRFGTPSITYNNSRTVYIYVKAPTEYNDYDVHEQDVTLAAYSGSQGRFKLDGINAEVAKINASLGRNADNAFTYDDYVAALEIKNNRSTRWTHDGRLSTSVFSTYPTEGAVYLSGVSPGETLELTLSLPGLEPQSGRIEDITDEDVSE